MFDIVYNGDQAINQKTNDNEMGCVYIKSHLNMMRLLTVYRN